MQRFQDLIVWQKSHEFVLKVYQITSVLPRNEEYGLPTQLQRSAVSVPANIAEACGRESQKEFARFSRISLGSANESEYFLILLKDLGYLSFDGWSEINSLLTELKKMLITLIRKISTSTNV